MRVLCHGGGGGRGKPVSDWTISQDGRWKTTILRNACELCSITMVFPFADVSGNPDEL